MTAAKPMLDIDAISEDIEMAQRSGEMARHVALDHGPELVAEIKRLRWQVDHGGGDHMCDECWPVEPDDDLS